MTDTESRDAPEPLMPLSEVASYLGESERTVRDWAQSAGLPVVRIGASWRFRQSDIDAWLKRQRPPTVPPVDPTPTPGQARQRKIQRANLDGTGVEDLVVTGLEEPFGIILGVE